MAYHPMSAPPAQEDRTREIREAILRILESKPCAALGELADAAGVSRTHLAKVRWALNLTLSNQGHESRIQTAYQRGRCYWYLEPLRRP